MVDIQWLKPDYQYSTENGTPYYFTPTYQLVCLGIVLRDIQGRDLTYLDWIREEASESYLNSLEFVVEFLSCICVENTDLLLKLPPSRLLELFNLYWEKVVQTPMTRDDFIKSVYFLNGGNFGNFPSYEKIPMTEFLTMVKVHNDYQESLEKKLNKR